MRKITLKIDTISFQVIAAHIEQEYNRLEKQDALSVWVVARLNLDTVQTAIVKNMLKDATDPMKLKLTMAEAMAFRIALDSAPDDDPWILGSISDCCNTIDRFIAEPAKAVLIS